MSTIDHAALGISRVITQYQTKEKFIAFLGAILAQSNNLETALQAILASSGIDAAVGTQLDLIGALVGIGRNVPDAQPAPFFGFISTANSLPYGDDVTGGGGAFYEEGTDALMTLTLADPLFRQFIRAVVIRDRSTGTLEDFINVLRAVFPTDTILVEDAPGKLQVNIGLNRETNASENAILSYTRILPKPAGVAVVNMPYTAIVQFFGFNPTDAPYGDDVTGGGGPFAEDTY